MSVRVVKLKPLLVRSLINQPYNANHLEQIKEAKNAAQTRKIVKEGEGNS